MTPDKKEAVTATTVLPRIDVLVDVARKVHAICAEANIEPVSLAVTAASYMATRGNINMQCHTVEEVDRIAAIVGAAPDDPDEPNSTRREDGLPSNYTREGIYEGTRVRVYTGRPIAS